MSSIKQLKLSKETKKAQEKTTLTSDQMIEKVDNFLKIETLGDSASLKELREEGMKLKENLKELNDLMTIIIQKQTTKSIIEGSKQKLKDKDQSEGSQSKDSRLKQLETEITMHRKVLTRYELELKQLEIQIEKRKNPKYYLELTDEIDKYKGMIEKESKECKDIEKKNKTKGKNLDIIQNVKGMPNNIKEANKK